jgi:hypothetical protein
MGNAATSSRQSRTSTDHQRLRPVPTFAIASPAWRRSGLSLLAAGDPAEEPWLPGRARAGARPGRPTDGIRRCYGSGAWSRARTVPDAGRACGNTDGATAPRRSGRRAWRGPPAAGPALGDKRHPMTVTTAGPSLTASAPGVAGIPRCPDYGRFFVAWFCQSGSAASSGGLPTNARRANVSPSRVYINQAVM